MPDLRRLALESQALAEARVVHRVRPDVPWASLEPYLRPVGPG